MFHVNLNSQAEFHDKHYVVRKLHESNEHKHVLFCFRPGQVLKEHKTSSHVTICVISGKIRFTLEDKTSELSQSDMVIIEPELIHALEALDESVVLVTLTPNPSVHTLLNI